MSSTDASIVIPSWNSESTIRECLESVFAQRTDREFEVIVVDSSSDGTADVVREFPQAKLVKLTKRTFSGAARNIGVSESSAPIVLFLDSDAIAEPDWLEKMLSWHEHEVCAAVAGGVLNGNPESLVGWASYITEFSDYIPAGKPRYRLTGVTANLSYKRSDLEACHGFDEGLKQYVDTEFNCRLNASGRKLLFVPSIRVKHKHRTTLRAYLKHEVGRGRSAVALRRHGFLPCSSLARYRWLCVLATGPMFVRLVFGNLCRFLPTKMLPAWRLAVVLPISIVGALAWSLGFLEEAVRPKIVLTGLAGSATHDDKTALSKGG